MTDDRITGQPGGGEPRSADRWQRELAQAQAELAQQLVEASAGQGTVRVVMSGTQECHRVVIHPDLLAEGDAVRLQDLVLLAINQAIKDSQLLAARRLSPLTGDLDQAE
jgi:DNA-binding YbaB/EbfC family protein